MKIKLQDYSLIGNEWIDEEIERWKKETKNYKADSYEYGYCQGKLMVLEELKEKLTPSEKLAETCYEEGKVDYKKGINNKEDFLTSEIEIL